jgi:hypothetical protein
MISILSSYAFSCNYEEPVIERRQARNVYSSIIPLSQSAKEEQSRLLSFGA